MRILAGTMVDHGNRAPVQRIERGIRDILNDSPFYGYGEEASSPVPGTPRH